MARFFETAATLVRIQLMPVFYFRLRFGHTSFSGDEGTQLDNLAAAVREAADTARELAAEIVEYGIVSQLKSISITDVSGQELASIALADFLPPSFLIAHRRCASR